MQWCTYPSLPVRLPAARRLSLPFRLMCGVLGCAAAPAVWGAPATDLPPDFDVSCALQSATGSGAARVLVNGQPGGSGYVVQVGADSISLSRRSKGASSHLATFDGLGLTAARKSPLKLTVKRRGGTLSVLAGSRLLMAVEDATYTGGSADSSASGGAAAGDVHVQPAEALYFSDDFMRQPNEPGEWSYLRGDWTIQTIGIVQRSANPFSLESRPGPDALASTGYPFWSDYAFEAAARGGDGDGFGICADLQDPQNYYRLRWTSGTAGNLALERVVNGKVTELARKQGGYVSNLWYLLTIRTTNGWVIGEVDHKPVLRVQDGTFGQGKIALYAEGAGHTIYFDSVLVRPSHLVYDEPGTNSLHHWQAEGSQAIGGDPDWDNYTVSASASGGAVGLPFHYRSASNFYLATFDQFGARLISTVGGERRVLSTSHEGLVPGRHHTLQAGYEDGYLWGAVDGKRVVEGLDPSLPSGRAGFERADGRSIQSVTIQAIEPPEPTDALTGEFTNIDHHQEMQGWAGPLSAWQPTEKIGPDPGYWHEGSLFGDLVLRVPLVAEDVKNGHFGIIMAADGRSPDTGYELDFAGAGSAINLALSRLGTRVALGRLKAPADLQDQVTLDVYRHGSFIYAGIGQNLPLRYHDDHPLDGSRIDTPVNYAPARPGHERLGIAVRGSTPVDLQHATLSNRHVYAETFHLAPVNWRPEGGIWEVTRRWSCQPGWTWYGGRGDGYTVNWNKAPREGDQSIDYFAAAMMGATDTSGNESWRDLNCALCSDGVNLFSGYTLVVGGWNNSVTRLYRKGKVVAENSQFHFPNSGAAHRLWFHIHIQKQGGQLHTSASYFDEGGGQHNDALLDWTDPNPLPGGYVGFWTYSNGMMLARAVLSSQQNGDEPVYAAEPHWTAQLPTDAPYPAAPIANVASAGGGSGRADHSEKRLSSFAGPPIVERREARTVLKVDLLQQRDAGKAPNPGRRDHADEAVTDHPVEIQARGVALTVEPGGIISNVRVHGKPVIQQILLDVRTAEWHQVKLTPQNAVVIASHGDQPGEHVDFKIHQPDLKMDLAGRVSVRILPDATIRVEGIVTPGSTFDSKRISLNVILPSQQYEGHEFMVVDHANGRVIQTPAQPLFPIQFATGIRRLVFRDTGIEIAPIAGTGVLEDLRHYGLAQFWFEQHADYEYPQVKAGARQYFGFNIRFRDPLLLAEP